MGGRRRLGRIDARRKRVLALLVPPGERGGREGQGEDEGG